jgi:glycosyltransferase involved in cell wall biosynthesis
MAVQLTIIIPIYNERTLLPTVSQRIMAAATTLPVASYELIWVDDASTDGSGDWLVAELALQPHCTVIRHSVNQGKGCALKTGLGKAAGQWTLIHDADLEYSPSDWAKVLAPLLSGEAEVVYGSRFLDPANRARFKPLYYWGNWGLTACFNALFGTHLTDMETGMKAFVTRRLNPATLKGQRFEIEPEISAVLGYGHRLLIKEVPIAYDPRSHEEGKKIRPIDGFLAVGMMLRCRLSRP